MKIPPFLNSTKYSDQGRPDYYITPSQDFTQYTRDCESKYWNRETAFDWSQNVTENLRGRLENLTDEDFCGISNMVLPMVKQSIEEKINNIEQHRLPLDEDALKDIKECLPDNLDNIDRALSILSPLKSFQVEKSRIDDQLEILASKLIDLKEQERLGLYKEGVKVRKLQSALEKQKQVHNIACIEDEINDLNLSLSALRQNNKTQLKSLKSISRKKIDSVQDQIMLDLESTRNNINKFLNNDISLGPNHHHSIMKDLILKRQVRGLKDVANHALVVEQSAIAPLTMGIIHYKRHREIQEALTTFINDEAKHSATFRRYLVDKLEAKEYISSTLIKGAERYMWIARFLPGTGLFLAVIVEAIGAAYLEFFGNKKYMPDPLFCQICKTISEQDEKRHMDLCVAIYNELFRRGTRSERFRNQLALRIIMKSVYGDKTEEHRLIQAFHAFGVTSDKLYQHIFSRLSAQLSRISMYVDPDKIFQLVGR